MTGEKAALLDECSTSEAQLQDVKVHTYIDIVKELCSVFEKNIASLHSLS